MDPALATGSGFFAGKIGSNLAKIGMAQALPRWLSKLNAIYMNTNATKIIADPLANVAAPLQIVLTYDHPPMAAAARELLGSFLTKWVADVDIHRDEWSFAELEHPQCRSESLELARHCDIFIIALIGINDLPPSFIGWINDWFESRANVETALIVLAGSHTANLWKLPRCASLASEARRHGLSFFTTSVVIPGAVLPSAAHPKALLARLATMNTELIPDFSGINE